MSQQNDFLQEAELVREQQVGSRSSAYEPDPAIQAGIDQAMEDSAGGPAPGSEQPGLFGMSGLSNSDIEAQKADIAERSRRVGT